MTKPNESGENVIRSLIELILVAAFGIIVALAAAGIGYRLLKFFAEI